MGAPRKIKSPKAMEQAWEEYKAACDSETATVATFSTKANRYIIQEIPKPCTYDIQGFCVYIHLTRSAFYDTYDKDPRYSDIVTRMHEESETDKRKKFEKGQVPAQLAALWMGPYGYTTKTAASVDVDMPIMIVDDV